ncbi:uncharacterized protein BKCO1_7000164 [Diplodia corticola]|uniref:Integral membrane protein n=1 Tax=Diplodia corticola TaxID=236234 RepID=A0A1J9RAC9_9PEZI|nr:uncharacterized protein BKCO1_7000164 [Diplodia corticola]OJD37425.1 integral membrane protein [Diplodia corticola]
MISADYPQTQTAFILAIQVPTIALVLLAVAARFFDRAYFTRGLMASDWLIIPAAILVAVCNAVFLVGISYGMSWHLWVLNQDQLVAIMKVTLAYRSIFGVAAAFIKVSICLTYIHLFPRSKVNVWFCRGTIAYCTIAGIILLVLSTFACRPISDFWSPYPKPNSCQRKEEILTTAVIQKATSEAIVFIWPVYFIWSLKLSRAVRLQLSILFSLGSVVFVLGIVKVWYLWYSYHTNDDPIWTSARFCLLETVEINLSLVCACLPHIKRIVKMLCCFQLHRRNDVERPQANNHNVLVAALQRKPSAIDLDADADNIHRPAAAALPLLPLPAHRRGRRATAPSSLPDTCTASSRPAAPRSTTLASLPTAANASMPDAPRAHLRPSSPLSSPHSFRPRLLAPRVVSPPADFDVTSTIDAIYRSGSIWTSSRDDAAAASACAPLLPPPQQPQQEQPYTPRDKVQKVKGEGRKAHATPQKQGTPTLPRSPGSMDLRDALALAVPLRLRRAGPPPRYRGEVSKGGVDDGGVDDDQQ